MSVIRAAVTDPETRRVKRLPTPAALESEHFAVTEPVKDGDFDDWWTGKYVITHRSTGRAAVWGIPGLLVARGALAILEGIGADWEHMSYRALQGTSERAVRCRNATRAARAFARGEVAS